MFLIRPYQPRDAVALTDIFYDTIHSIGLEHYTAEQVNAWAPLPRDYPKWQKRYESVLVYVAEINNNPVGFLSIEADGHIDLGYTHKDYQRQGIASKLYQHLEEKACAGGIERLYTEASHFARPFFKKKGFTVIQKNEIIRLDQILTNFSMEKHIQKSKK